MFESWGVLWTSFILSRSIITCEVLHDNALVIEKWYLVTLRVKSTVFSVCFIVFHHIMIASFINKSPKEDKKNDHKERKQANKFCEIITLLNYISVWICINRSWNGSFDAKMIFKEKFEVLIFFYHKHNIFK